MHTKYILSFLILISLALFSTSTHAQLLSTSTNNIAPDSYTITLSGTKLNTVSALNISYTFTGGQAALDSSLTFMSNGGSTLLSNLDSAMSIISIVWTGAITDGKATISGKLKSGTVTGNPSLAITKVEAAGGANITGDLVINTNLSGPPPPPVEEPIETPQEPIEDTEDEDIEDIATPLLDIQGEDTYTLNTKRNTLKLTAEAIDFESQAKCIAKSSLSSYLKLRPIIFYLSPTTTEKTLTGTIPTARARYLIKKNLSKLVTVTISCNNDTEAEFDILLEPPEEN